MLDISNEQTMRIRIVTDQPNRRSTSPTKRELVGCVNAQSGRAVRSRNVSVPFGCSSVDILDMAVCWISCCEKVELIEEKLFRRIIIDELIRRDPWCTVPVTEHTIRDTLRKYKWKK
jgi:hypothetical protein